MPERYDARRPETKAIATSRTTEEDPVQWRAEGVRGCDDPGHPAWGIQRPSFLRKSVDKCLKMPKIREKKVMTLGIEDMGGIPKMLFLNKICRYTVFELPGGWGVEPPTSSCRPPTSGQNSTPGGVEFQPSNLSFAEVAMLLDSHFLLMQFLKYLQCDDLNVTTILIHIEGCSLPNCP